MSWDLLFQTAPSPLQELYDDSAESLGIRILIKRDDLLALFAMEEPYPAFCGNKWRKLKYNLQEARKIGMSGLLTFGGAYSNHIAAVAAAGRIFGFSTLGFIRGELHTPLNPTLAFATECGMELRYLDRTTFKELRENRWQDPGLSFSDDFFLLPEGGTNELALKGCMELGAELNTQTNADFYCIPCGTGGTIAGLIAGLGGLRQVIGFPALKSGAFLYRDIEITLEKYVPEVPPKFKLQTDYHFGGYARSNPLLFRFIHDFHVRHGILLDHVYTAKMFFGVFDLIQKRAFPAGTTICLIHTGGLQGSTPR